MRLAGLAPHSRPPVPGQRAQVDRLRRHTAARRSVPAAARRLADIGPVRRPQADPALSRPDKGLDQKRRDTIARRVVTGRRTQAQAECLRGQVPAPGPGTDKKTRQPHYPVKMRLAAARVPSDPPVARLQRQRRGGEQAAAEPAVLRAGSDTEAAAPHAQPPPADVPAASSR